MCAYVYNSNVLKLAIKYRPTKQNAFVRRSKSIKTHRQTAKCQQRQLNDINNITGKIIGHAMEICAHFLTIVWLVNVWRTQTTTADKHSLCIVKITQQPSYSYTHIACPLCTSFVSHCVRSCDDKTRCQRIMPTHRNDNGPYTYFPLAWDMFHLHSFILITSRIQQFRFYRAASSAWNFEPKQWQSLIWHLLYIPLA